MISRNKKTVLEWIRTYKIITIIRGIQTEKILKTVQALYDGGIRLLEITFDQNSSRCVEDTALAIERICDAFGDKVCVGGGTVLNKEQVDAAGRAGAQFILSPNTDPEVIGYARDLGLATIPGALTPSEVVKAYCSGADFVKLFPAEILGIPYMKSIFSPLNHIPMIAVGGINEKNMNEFLSIGFKGVGVGSNMVRQSLIEAGRYDEITRFAKCYTDALRSGES